VHDGDTITVRRTDGSRTERVRLIGIDTPETRDPGTPVECGGPEATAGMLFLTFSQPADTNADGILDQEGGLGALVELQTDRSQDLRDSFGRALAFADVVADIPPAAGTAGYDLGRTMIFAGLSPVFVFERRFARHGAYVAAEQDARASNRGSWSACGGNFHSAGG
jgi:micrococcal nuclease